MMYLACRSSRTYSNEAHHMDHTIQTCGLGPIVTACKFRRHGQAVAAREICQGSLILSNLKL